MTRRLPVMVDFDGTIAEALWTPDNPTTEIGDPIRVNIVKLRELRSKGWRAVIHTARPWSDKKMLIQWMLANKVPIDGLVMAKPLAAAYVDDRAIHASDASWVPEQDALSVALSSTLRHEISGRVV